MAFPSNAVRIHQPQIPVDQSIYEFSTSAKAKLGTKLEVGERVFFYAQASASLGAGSVVCSLRPTASHQSGILSIAAATIGAKTISATSSANVAADYYAEGHFGAAAGAAVGHTIKVIGHNSGSAGLTVTLYDPLTVAITAGTVFWLAPNEYKNVWVGSKALDTVVGVVPIDVTSGGYFWLQTRGIANPKHVGATPAGASLALGTTGSVDVFSVTGTNAATGFALVDYVTIIGKNSPLAASAGEANPVFLNIRE